MVVTFCTDVFGFSCAAAVTFTFEGFNAFIYAAGLSGYYAVVPIVSECSTIELTANATLGFFRASSCSA